MAFRAYRPFPAPAPPTRAGVGVLPVLVLAALLAGSVGCVRGTDLYRERARQRVDDIGRPEPVTTAIAAIVETDGQILAELPVGSDQLIQPGTLMQAYDAERPGTAKGLLQVMTILGRDSCYCRLIGGLYDRRSPLTVGDRVVEILDIAEIEGTEDIEAAAEASRTAAAEAERDAEETFANLRAHYERNLAELRREHQAELDELRGRFERDAAAAERRHRAAIERLNADHRSQQDTLRATLAAKTATAIRRDREERQREFERLTAALAKEAADREKLVARNNELRRRVSELLARDEERAAACAAEVRAEVETRQVLEAKLATLRARLEGEEAVEPAVLTIDGREPETVLERLERVTRERRRMRDRVEELTAELERLRAAKAAGDGATEADLADTVAALRTEVAGLQDSLAALELVRLRCERAYFGLAQEILRLPEDLPAVQRLQEHLRRRLEADDPGKAPDATGAEETP